MNTALLRRPGGRSAQVQAQVRAALEALVSEQGRDKVTVPAVAERAGVSASSIYRRWGDLPGLLAETATHRLDPNRPLPDTGNLHRDLTAWAGEFTAHVCRPASTSLLKAAAALPSGEDTNCLRNRKAEAAVLVGRAVARGEAAPSTQQVIDHVVAPVVFRLLFGGDALPAGLAVQLVDELFAVVPATRAVTASPGRSSLPTGAPAARKAARPLAAKSSARPATKPSTTPTGKSTKKATTKATPKSKAPSTKTSPRAVS